MMNCIDGRMGGWADRWMNRWVDREGSWHIYGWYWVVGGG